MQIGCLAFNFEQGIFKEFVELRTPHINILKEFQALKQFLFEHYNDFMIQSNPYTNEHVSFSAYRIVFRSFEISIIIFTY